MAAAADDIDEIPNSVITEAVNNAIAHRNYANNGSIQIEVYQDRIEVISSGRLMLPLTVESLYGKHESVAPNPHIARAMFWVKYIETVGTGLNELMGACAKAGLKRPTIEANDIHFRLIIWRPIKKPINEPLNKPQDAIGNGVRNAQNGCMIRVSWWPESWPESWPETWPMSNENKILSLLYYRAMSKKELADFQRRNHRGGDGGGDSCVRWRGGWSVVWWWDKVLHVVQ